MKDNSEPAFPCGVDVTQNQFTPSCSMTLRDYFAAKAIDCFNKHIIDYGWSDAVLTEHAKQAYRIADAMLKARKL